MWTHSRQIAAWCKLCCKESTSKLLNLNSDKGNEGNISQSLLSTQVYPYFTIDATRGFILNRQVIRLNGTCFPAALNLGALSSAVKKVERNTHPGKKRKSMWQSAISHLHRFLCNLEKKGCQHDFMVLLLPPNKLTLLCQRRSGKSLEQH